MTAARFEELMKDKTLMIVEARTEDTQTRLFDAVSRLKDSGAQPSDAIEWCCGIKTNGEDKTDLRWFLCVGYSAGSETVSAAIYTMVLGTVFALNVEKNVHLHTRDDGTDEELLAGVEQKAAEGWAQHLYSSHADTSWADHPAGSA